MREPAVSQSFPCTILVSRVKVRTGQTPLDLDLSTTSIKSRHSLRSIGHAEGCQVTVGEGEQGHDGHEDAVVREDDGQSGVPHVTEHQQRDEDQARQHGQGEQSAVFGRLWRRPAGERQEQEVLSKGGGLTHWTTDTELWPTRSRTLKTMKQQMQVKTLSAGGK